MQWLLKDTCHFHSCRKGSPFLSLTLKLENLNRTISSSRNYQSNLLVTKIWNILSLAFEALLMETTHKSHTVTSSSLRSRISGWCMAVSALGNDSQFCSLDIVLFVHHSPYTLAHSSVKLFLFHCTLDLKGF